MTRKRIWDHCNWNLQLGRSSVEKVEAACCLHKTVHAVIRMNAENYLQTSATSECLLRNSFQILGQVVKEGGLQTFAFSPVYAPMMCAEGKGNLGSSISPLVRSTNRDRSTPHNDSAPEINTNPAAALVNSGAPFPASLLPFPLAFSNCVLSLDPPSLPVSAQRVAWPQTHISYFLAPEKTPAHHMLLWTLQTWHLIMQVNKKTIVSKANLASERIIY